VPQGEYSIDRLGADALAVLDAAGADRAHVCGLSLGGLTAMWLGIHAPRRVNRLVLASTAARIATPDLWSERIRQVRAEGLESVADGSMGRWFTDEFRESRPDVVVRHRAMVTSCPQNGYLGCCAVLRDTDLTGDLSQVTAATLVISGTVDPVTPPSDGRAIRDRIDGATMVTLAGAHLPNVERAEAFNTAVIDFLG
jgi:3-oxoadipate enol-lactonase